MDLWVMVNTRAGKQRAREYGEQIREALAREGAVPRLCYTETLEQASALLEEAARRRPDLLVCCGGDGTLSQAVNRLEEQGASLPLGYIPLGTTNDFASSLGLSRDPEQAAGQVLRGKVHPLDLGRLQGRRFLFVASFGAFTQSSYKTGQGWKSALGHLAYVLESLRELQPLEGEIRQILPSHGECPIEPVYLSRVLEDALALRDGKRSGEPHPTLPCRICMGKWTGFLAE